ncbi:MAG: signal peptidase I [Rickettsiales bacterium]|nr:signal peptidase I [Rickettsiales bacterium]
MTKVFNELKLLAIAILIAVTIRSFFFEPFHIPSGSMKSNLLTGDFVFVSKFSYGYSKYSFPFGIMPIKDRIFASEPMRGDVVVFRLPTNPNINYVKRLIGLPGDKIQVKQSKLYINGELIKRSDKSEFATKDHKDKDIVFDQYLETLPSGKSYNILEEEYNLPQDNTREYVVPEKHYFFLGDNRDNSKDSRFIYDVGFVPYRNLVGKVEMVFVSYDRSELPKSFFGRIYEFFFKMRFDRMFKDVD